MGTNYGGGTPPDPSSERQKAILRNKKRGLVETVEQRKAFLAYYGMGSQRSLYKTSDALEIPEQTLKQWMAQFSWIARCAEMDDKIGKALEEKMGKDLVRARSKAIHLIEDVMGEFSTRLKKGQISAMKVSEINELLKTYMLINGGATSRTDHTGKVEIDHDHQFTARERLLEIRKERGLLPGSPIEAEYTDEGQL